MNPYPELEEVVEAEPLSHSPCPGLREVASALIWFHCSAVKPGPGNSTAVIWYFLEHSLAAVGLAVRRLIQDRGPADGPARRTATPSAVERWLDGVDSPSLDFERRLLQAEGFYLALCEALLTVRPADAVRLWRALRAMSRIRFNGASSVVGYASPS